MRMSFFCQRVLVGILLMCQGFLSGCTEQPTVHQTQLYTFGTLVDISLWDVPETEANHAVELMAKALAQFHHDWHAWQPGPLTALNEAIAAGKTGTVAEETLLLPLLYQAKTFSLKSDHLFNPTIGKLIRLWGFQDDELPTGPPPSAKAIAALVALTPTIVDVTIQDHQITSRNPAVQFDLGAFAKGFAVDWMIEKLQTLDIHNAIVNAGGNLKAMGQKEQQPWRIGIRDPSGEGVLAAINLQGKESVITSGHYERYREYQGVRYSHILDPRTGKPATDFASVTVIDPWGALADAASTALIIAGPQDWYRIARQMDIQYVMLVDKAGVVTMNPAMAKRVEFLSETPPKIVISQPLAVEHH